MLGARYFCPNMCMGFEGVSVRCTPPRAPKELWGPCAATDLPSGTVQACKVPHCCRSSCSLVHPIVVVIIIQVITI